MSTSSVSSAAFVGYQPLSNDDVMKIKTAQDGDKPVIGQSTDKRLNVEVTKKAQVVMLTTLDGPKADGDMSLNPNAPELRMVSINTSRSIERINEALGQRSASIAVYTGLEGKVEGLNELFEKSSNDELLQLLEKHPAFKKISEDYQGAGTRDDLMLLIADLRELLSKLHQQMNSAMTLLRTQASEASARSIVDGGKAALNGAIGSAALTMGVVAIGAGMQVKGIRMKSASLKHNTSVINQQNKVMHDSKALLSGATDSKQIRALQNKVNEAQSTIAARSSAADKVNLKADKLSVGGSTTSNVAVTLGGISQSAARVDEAKANASSQLSNNEGLVSGDAADNAKKSKEKTNEILESMMQIINRLLENRNATVAEMARGMKI